MRVPTAVGTECLSITTGRGPSFVPLPSLLPCLDDHLCPAVLHVCPAAARNTSPQTHASLLSGFHSFPMPTAETFSLRSFRRADAPAVQTLWTSRFGGDPSTQTNWMEAALNPAHTAAGFVAVTSEGTIVGTSFLDVGHREYTHGYLGLDVLNPVQAGCPGMDAGELKREYGADLAFMGGVDTQHLLPRGSSREVYEEVSRLIDVMTADGGGYILAASHTVPPEAPLENIFALYEAAGVSRDEIRSCIAAAAT